MSGPVVLITVWGAGVGAVYIVSTLPWWATILFTITGLSISYFRTLNRIGNGSQN